MSHRGKGSNGSLNSLSESLLDESESVIPTSGKRVDPVAAAKDYNYNTDTMQRLDDFASRYAGFAGLNWAPPEQAVPEKSLCDRLREAICGPRS